MQAMAIKLSSKPLIPSLRWICPGGKDMHSFASIANDIRSRSRRWLKPNDSTSEHHKHKSTSPSDSSSKQPHHCKQHKDQLKDQASLKDITPLIPWRWIRSSGKPGTWSTTAT